MTAAALVAALLLVGAASAWGAFVTEGSPYTVGNDPYSLQAADFNGDGRPDVATINGSSNDVSVFLRQATGFGQEAGSPVAVGSGPSGAAVGDYNGDGRPDLAVSSFVQGNVSVLLRQPAGGFALEGGAPVSLGTRISAVAAGDFNSDGRIDLAAAEYDSSQVAILLRNAQNTGFTVSATFPTGSIPSAIAVGDYNGDGLADLAIANRGSDSATILLRSGGTFTSEAALPVGDEPVAIVAADFDGNGRADLALPNYTPGTVSVFLRNAANTGFTAETPITVSATPANIAAADFNRDGRPDLAVPANSGAVDILNRNAGGGFTRDQPIPVAGAVNGVAAADFNGDSRPDVAVSSYTNVAPADTFSVLLNRAPALPKPVAGKTVNVKPVSGTVKIKRRGSKKYVRLLEAAHIPVGSSIDTRQGRIAITAAQGKGKTATANFYDGLFKLTQTKGKKPLATLALIEKLTGCKAKGKKASTAAKKKKKRRLWGDGKGHYRTKGKNSAATVIGTKWLVEDRCTSTLTRVARGKVSVRDFAKKKTVTVKKGHRYIARAKR